jgi:hypothetical protein
MKSAQDKLNESLDKIKTSNAIENDEEAKGLYSKISDKLDGFNKDYAEITINGKKLGFSFTPVKDYNEKMFLIILFILQPMLN